MNSKNSFVLDFLRVLASQAVLLGHCFNIYGVTPLKDQTYFPFIQTTGVVLLFAMSGILFAYSVNRRGGGYGFRQYLANRLIRIKVPYVAAMVVIAALSALTILLNAEAFGYYDAFNLKTFIGNIFMLQDYPVMTLLDLIFETNIGVTSFSSARPFWTLAVEWWIYMCFGYFWLYLRKLDRISLWNLIVMGFFSVVPLYNLVAGRGNGLTWVWLGGVAIGILYKEVKIESVLLKWSMFWGSLMVLLGCAVVFKEAYRSGFQVMILMTLFSLLVLFKDDNCQVTKNYGTAIIRCMAGYSYSLYLLHYSIIRVMMIALNDISAELQLVLAILISNVVAYIFARVFERKESPIVSLCEKQINKILKV